MKRVSAKFREAAKAPVKTLGVKLTFEPRNDEEEPLVITSSDNLISLTIEQTGELFSTAMASATVKLLGTDYDLANRTTKVELMMDGSQVVITSIDQLIYLQDFADLNAEEWQAVVDSMEMEKVYTLKDCRDNREYKIAKVKTGRVMFCENLRLQKYLCTPEDTDMEEGSFELPGSDLSGFNNTYTEARVYVDETYGGYYNHFAAVVGESSKESQIDTKHSILPKGWTLPNYGEWTQLIKAYGGDSTTGSENLQSLPLNFQLNGYVENKQVMKVGENGRYFGASADMTPNMTLKVLGLFLNPTRAIALWGHVKIDGVGVRGILRKPTGGGNMRIEDLLYLQDFAYLTREQFRQVKESMVLEKSYTLKDFGSGTDYKIAKLKDDRIWFMENYRVGSNEEATILSPEYYNVGKEFELVRGQIENWKDKTSPLANQWWYLHEKYGGYYCYYVLFCAGNNTDKNILPLGWKVPDEEEMSGLRTHYGNNMYAEPAPMFVGGGDILDKLGVEREGIGYYHVGDSKLSYFMAIGRNGKAENTRAYGADGGFQVRAVLREPEEA